MTRFKDIALAMLLLIVVPLGMSFKSERDARLEAEADLNARKVVACPRELKGRELQSSIYMERDLYRPRTATLSCLYREKA